MIVRALVPRRWLIAAALMLIATASLASTGPFSFANGYFSVTGDNGMITSIRLDASGQGRYGSNAVATGGHFGFVLDDVLLSAAGAQWTLNGNTLQVTGLPGGASLTGKLNVDIFTLTLNFTGGGARNARAEWDLPYLDKGFYQRKTGKNYDTSVTPVTPVDLDMPFECFYNTANGNFRPVEIFKRSVEWVNMNGGTTREDTAWTRTYCRGRVGSDASLSCAQGSNALTMSFLPATDRLTLLYAASVASGLTIKLQALPRSYTVQLDKNRVLPEFYVKPEQTIPALFDAGNVQYNASDLLTEFFQHTVFWWAAGGFNGGIWADWSMIPGCFMGSGNPHTEGTKASLAGWVTGDDGYGHPGYAYTWGTQRGWPFPSDKDSRHFDTNAIFITALWRYVIWTGDTAFLQGGTGDRHMTFGYSDGTSEQIPNTNGYPTMLNSGMTLGQTFTAKKSLSRVASVNPTWGTTSSGFTLSLYTWPGRQLIQRQAFINCKDNAANTLTLNQARPAGQYYLEMSDPVGTIGWWSPTTDIYAGGVDCVNGQPNKTLIEKARDLMTYQQQTLLGAQQNLLVLGSNIGSNDHLGRGGLDVGCHYYDILPFGYKDNMTNITYYQSVRAMADLEEMTSNTTAARTYRDQLARIRKAYNDTFWRMGLDRDQSARYIGTVDVNGAGHDYGYTFLSTMALTAGLTEDYPDHAAAIFRWLDHGESQHGEWKRDCSVRIGYASGQSETIPDSTNNENTPKQLTPGSTLGQVFFATEPFSSVASHNPTWNTTDSGFTLTLYEYPTRRKIAEKTFTKVVDNSFNTLSFAVQPEGFYLLEMSKPVGTVGWWASGWESDIYRRWVFAPRSSTRSNVSWWVYPIGNAGAQGAAYQWDDQLQNGGCDLYESGFDVIARARYQGGDQAWDRLKMILRRYADPDRLSTRLDGFYGEAIQGGRAGSAGWMFSEFPETAVLGASFFLGFFGAEPSLDGLLLTPHVPTGRGITTIGARNIYYQGAMFDLEATATNLHIVCRSNPQNLTFYMTGRLQGSGLFTQDVPLVEGAVVLSLKPQGPSPRAEASLWSIYE